MTVKIPPGDPVCQHHEITMSYQLVITVFRAVPPLPDHPLVVIILMNKGADYLMPGPGSQGQEVPVTVEQLAGVT